MSTKKDKFTKRDISFMKLAINLARDRHGLTGPNPSVGCIIVKNNEIISFGQTGYNGRPHAEYNAIKSCKENLKGSTLYSTLEPCAHFGKTPPCCNLIIKSKIKKVIFSITDVDPITKGKSFKILKNNKIKVMNNLLHNVGNSFYKPYKINKLKKLPYVTGKLAVSIDNFIYSKKKTRITNKHSDNFSQILRYKNDSILISSKTLHTDNPKLNCRINGLNKYSPKRIILDKNLTIKKNSYIYSTSNKKNTIIFYNKDIYNKAKSLQKRGFTLIKTSLNKNNFFDLRFVLRKIYSLGCRNLLVEGGKKLTESFLKDGLFNKFYLFKGSKTLGINGKMNVSPLLNQLYFKYKNKSKINSFTENDIIKVYK